MSLGNCDSRSVVGYNFGMRKKRTMQASMAFVLFGCLVLLKAFTNPRLSELRVVDALQLVAVGMFVGVGIVLFSRFFRND